MAAQKPANINELHTACKAMTDHLDQVKTGAVPINWINLLQNLGKVITALANSGIFPTA